MLYKLSLLAIPRRVSFSKPPPHLCCTGPRPRETPGKLRAAYRSLAQVVLLHQLGHLPLIWSKEPAHRDHHRLVQLLLLDAESTVFPYHTAQETPCSLPKCMQGAARQPHKSTFSKCRDRTCCCFRVSQRGVTFPEGLCGPVGVICPAPFSRGAAPLPLCGTGMGLTLRV